MPCARAHVNQAKKHTHTVIVGPVVINNRNASPSPPSLPRSIADFTLLCTPNLNPDSHAEPDPDSDWDTRFGMQSKVTWSIHASRTSINTTLANISTAHHTQVQHPPVSISSNHNIWNERISTAGREGVHAANCVCELISLALFNVEYKTSPFSIFVYLKKLF